MELLHQESSSIKQEKQVQMTFSIAYSAQDKSTVKDMLILLQT